MPDNTLLTVIVDIIYPYVLEAAAVGVPDDKYGQEIEAFVVLKPGT